MRHGKKFNHLGRKAPHRKAMLSNMASSLIQNKRITTTVAKAKALRKYIEPIITRSKEDTTHSRRMVFSYLQDKESTKELFSAVAEKVSERPGGYTRIIKTGTRLGDNAEMCIIELVDFNTHLVKEPKKAKTRRSRRGGSKPAAPAPETKAAEAKAEVKEEAAVETKAEEVAEAKAEEAVEAKAEKPEEKAAEVEAPAKEEAKAEAPKEEAKAEATEETPAEEKAEEKKEEPKAEAPEEKADDKAQNEEEEEEKKED